MATLEDSSSPVQEDQLVEDAPLAVCEPIVHHCKSNGHVSEAGHMPSQCRCTHVSMRKQTQRHLRNDSLMAAVLTGALSYGESFSPTSAITTWHSVNQLY